MVRLFGRPAAPRLPREPNREPVPLTALAPPPAGATPRPGLDGELVCSAEALSVGRAVHSDRQVRVARRIVSEEVTRSVIVRREELVLEDAPAVSSALPPSGPGEPAQVDDPFGEGVPVEMVLHREEVVIETRLVPYARVRVVRALEGVETEVRAEVAHEEVVVERHWAWSTAAQQDGGGGVPARSVAADSQPPGDGLD